MIDEPIFVPPKDDREPYRECFFCRKRTWLNVSQPPPPTGGGLTGY